VFVAGGRAVSKLYYSQRARSVCVCLSAFSFCILKILLKSILLIITQVFVSPELGNRSSILLYRPMAVMISG